MTQSLQTGKRKTEIKLGESLAGYSSSSCLALQLSYEYMTQSLQTGRRKTEIKLGESFAGYSSSCLALQLSSPLWTSYNPVSWPLLPFKILHLFKSVCNPFLFTRYFPVNQAVPRPHFVFFTMLYFQCNNQPQPWGPYVFLGAGWPGYTPRHWVPTLLVSYGMHGLFYFPVTIRKLAIYYN